jgi:hypothetical protein
MIKNEDRVPRNSPLSRAHDADASPQERAKPYQARSLIPIPTDVPGNHPLPGNHPPCLSGLDKA